MGVSSPLMASGVVSGPSPRGGTQLAPFELGTDPRFAAVPFSTTNILTGSDKGGGTLVAQLRRNWLISSLFLVLRGKMNLQSATSLNALNGPWGIINKILVELNTNGTVLHNYSGRTAFERNFMLYPGFNPAASALADVYSAAVGGVGDNTWNLMLEIPIGLNRTDKRRYGLINLQDPTVTCTVSIIPGSNLEAVTAIGTGTGASLTASLYQYGYEIPPRGFEAPPDVLHRVLEESQPVSGVGTQVEHVIREGTIIRIHQRQILNGALDSTDVGQYRIRYNTAEVPYTVDRWIMEWWQRQLYGADLPTGVIAWDFWNSTPVPGFGPLWNAIRSGQISAFDLESDINAGTTIAAGDRILYVRELIESSVPVAV